MSGNVITSRQRKAIAALLSEKTIADAAEKVKVNERTIYRWLSLSHFRLALMEAEWSVIDNIVRKLIQLQEPAIEMIHKVMVDDDTQPSVKLRAAQTVLDYLIKIRQLRNIENRLVKLEERIYGQ